MAIKIEIINNGSNNGHDFNGLGKYIILMGIKITSKIFNGGFNGQSYSHTKIMLN